MTFVIGQSCCGDTSCVAACPVDCIRPVPGAGDVTPSRLYIDPQTCVDCGACVPACPVGAIYYEDDLPADEHSFLDINAQYFTQHPLEIRALTPAGHRESVAKGALRVAVVGAGPAACYAVNELALISGVDISLFERLPTPYGLIRSGVAPDHQHTKDVVSAYEPVLDHSAVRCYFNVTVGSQVRHDELLAHHHAVIYAVGASRSRTLDIAGEHLFGSHAAGDFVGWYNGHPDHAEEDFDLAGRRAVIVGNGNVALDVARILVMDRSELATTDIAEHALTQLATSEIEEVVVLGRRGAADAAFSVGELLALGNLAEVDIVVDGDIGGRPDDDFDRALKYDVVREYAGRPTTAGNRRIVLRFATRPVSFIGSDRVEGLTVAEGDTTTTIETALVLRAIGYRGSPIEGLPFDDALGIVPNESGRVARDGAVIPGVYVTGWIKRGPHGVIGTNRSCARETIGNLLDDLRRGLFSSSVCDVAALGDLLASRGAEVVDWQGWRTIDQAERQRGNQTSHPRVKFVNGAELLSTARAK